MSPAYLTVADVAARFQVSNRTVERMISTGQLSAVRFGPKLLRIPPAALSERSAPLVNGGYSVRLDLHRRRA
jgi:excisionase family DNA binding protein